MVWCSATSAYGNSTRHSPRRPVYCRDFLGIDPHKKNGGLIALGHPYGMTGAGAVGHALLEAKRRDAQFAVVSICVGGE
uniref:hypothetical protein n=1 Tax=[Mycobacterium] appelbergii TaxID=2939269 RepID=UPI0029392C59|nr:hypothetical protein [Mycobacterium sp. 21AC1]